MCRWGERPACEAARGALFRRVSHGWRSSTMHCARGAHLRAVQFCIENSPGAASTGRRCRPPSASPRLRRPPAPLGSAPSPGACAAASPPCASNTHQLTRCPPLSLVSARSFFTPKPGSDQPGAPTPGAGAGGATHEAKKAKTRASLPKHKPRLPATARSAAALPVRDLGLFLPPPIRGLHATPALLCSRRVQT